MIRQPIVWVTLLFIAGLIVGHYFASVLWLPLAAITLLFTFFVRRWRYLPDVTILLFWVMLGAARISVAPTESSPALTSLRQVMKPRAQLLVQRLQEAGLQGEPLALSAALLLGQRDLIEHTTRQAFSRVGASHLLALSGMHLGILYGLLHLLLLRWRRGDSWRWYLLPPVLLCIWGYAFLAGLPLSLVRAAVMLSVFTIGTLAQRQTSSLHLLSLSALVILLVSPRALWDVGFQLSFLAVLFIILLLLPWRDSMRALPLHPVWEMLGVSLAAQVGTAPLVAFYFHTLPLTGFLLSLVLVPFTTLIIWLGLLTLLLPIAPLAWLLTHCLQAQSWIIHQWGQIPGTTLTDLHPSLLIVLLLYALLLIAAFRINAGKV